MSASIDTDRDAALAESNPEDHSRLVADTEDLADGKVFAPSSYPGAAIVGSLLGLGLLGLAAVGIRDHIVRFGWISGTPWTDSAADWIARSTWQDWMWPAAVGFIVVGLLFLWLALVPRRRTHETLDRYGVMWTRRGDAARQCSAAVMNVPGVEHATTIVRRRSAKVIARTSTTVDAETVRAAAVAALAPVRDSPKVKVRLISRSATERKKS